MTWWPPEYHLAVHLALCILFDEFKLAIQASNVTTLPSIAAHPAFRYTC